VELPLRALFESPTVASVAALIAAALPASAPQALIPEGPVRRREARVVNDRAIPRFARHGGSGGHES
jgi:hypothetical protein